MFSFDDFFQEYNAFNHKLGILTKFKVISIQNHELIEKLKNSVILNSC
jgi:hypothetical protein